MEYIFQQIRNERARQDAKWREQNHDDSIWSIILGEEIGEIDEAVLHDLFGGKHAGTLETELIQAAAVIVAWLEARERRVK